MQTLPYVDEHRIVARAPAGAVWDAARAALDVPQHGIAGAYARLVAVRGDRLFDVVSAERPVLLALAGHHRFSRYALTFTIRPVGPDRTELTAHTSAEFPGAAGQLYKTAVIRSRAHVVITRLLLRRIARSAARHR